MAVRIDTSDWSDTDLRYGWVFGVDGLVNATEAAEKIGKSQPWMSAILNSEARKEPGGRGWPIRAGKSQEDGRAWWVCLRSIDEYMRAHRAVEV